MGLKLTEGEVMWYCKVLTE